jgi:tetratricopeptide (TPR) repeat protein
MEAELGVVFAQEIPVEAKRAFEGAVKDFASKRTAEGFKGLNRAIELKSDYYLALNKMGRELFVQARYEEAIPFLFKAGELNPKSPTTFYYLGAALFHLGKNYHKAALAALSRASILAPLSPQIQYMLGRAQRSESKFNDAEKSLLKAKDLAKSSVPEIHIELAQLYGNDLKNYGKAADELESYMKASGKKDEKMQRQIDELRAKAK